MNNIQVIDVKKLVEMWRKDENIFLAIPEFQFIIPLASKVKEKNCYCGLSKELQDITYHYNSIIRNLEENTISRIKSVFGFTKLSFAIQTSQNFEVIEY